MKWFGKKPRTPRTSEATQARKEAERELVRVREETKEYEALGNSLRRIREANHLTELILSIPPRRHS